MLNEKKRRKENEEQVKRMRTKRTRRGGKSKPEKEQKDQTKKMKRGLKALKEIKVIPNQCGDADKEVTLPESCEGDSSTNKRRPKVAIYSGTGTTRGRRNLFSWVAGTVQSLRNLHKKDHYHAKRCPASEAH